MDRLAHMLERTPLTANAATWCGWLLGLVAALAIWQHLYLTGLVVLLVSRLFDALDGALARRVGATDYGGFLDIVLDFAFYGLIPLAFIAADPGNNALAGSLLILTFYVNGASFLTYALMAEKRGVDQVERGSKSLLYTTGLAEATETIVFFAVCCIFPNWFATLAYVFAAIVIVTTASRFALAKQNFSGDGTK